MADVDRFRSTYRASVSDVLRFLTPQMQAELAAHNAGWRMGATDFRMYLEASEARFAAAFEALEPNISDKVCDIGGFWGVWPLTLVRLGLQGVTMTEALQYYSDTFRDLFDYLGAQGVEVVDFDPFSENAEPEHSFDIVTLFAVLEHYPHSPRDAMRRVKLMMNHDARLLIEVPNIAYWQKRVALMRGESPLPSLTDVWGSTVPFTGHHREYSRSDLRQLAVLAGLRILREYDVDYSSSMSLAEEIKLRIRHPIVASMRSRADAREIIAMVCAGDTRVLLDESRRHSGLGDGYG